MHTLLNHLHSVNRYLLLAVLVFVLYRTVSGWLGQKNYDKTDNVAAGVLVGLAHLQLLLGLIMYFGTSAYTTPWFSNFGAGMKNSWARYFLVEHNVMMITAIALLQIGRIASKRAADATLKHKKMAIYTGLALLLILVSLLQKGLLFSTMAAAAGGN